MLFRAPGIHKAEKRSTAIGIDEVAKQQSLASFNAAVDDMIGNLDTELSQFKIRVKDEKLPMSAIKRGTVAVAYFGLSLYFLRFCVSATKSNSLIAKAFTHR